MGKPCQGSLGPMLQQLRCFPLQEAPSSAVAPVTTVPFLHQSALPLRFFIFSATSFGFLHLPIPAMFRSVVPRAAPRAALRQSKSTVSPSTAFPSFYCIRRSRRGYATEARTYPEGHFSSPCANATQKNMTSSSSVVAWEDTSGR